MATQPLHQLGAERVTIMATNEYIYNVTVDIADQSEDFEVFYTCEFGFLPTRFDPGAGDHIEVTYIRHIKDPKGPVASQGESSTDVPFWLFCIIRDYVEGNERLTERLIENARTEEEEKRNDYD